MRIYTTRINQSKLIEDIARLLFGIKDKDAILNDVSEKIDRSDGSLVSFLKEIDSIEDEPIRRACRKAAIAQMFNAKLDHVDAAYDVAFLKFPRTTAVVSKYGEVLIDEDVVWVNPNAHYGPGWPMKSVTDGKWGFFNNSGSILLPCIFDDHDLHVYELNHLYNRVNFSLQYFGLIENQDRSSLERLIRMCEYPEYIVCRNKDSLVFVLAQQDLLKDDDKYWYNTEDEKVSAIKKLSSESEMRDMILSKDELVKYL